MVFLPDELVVLIEEEQLTGAWRYKENNWVARAGDTLYEVAGSSHTPEAFEDSEIFFYTIATRSAIFGDLFDAYAMISAATGKRIRHFQRPLTVHPTGGACLAQTVESGVVDSNERNRPADQNSEQVTDRLSTDTCCMRATSLLCGAT